MSCADATMVYLLLQLLLLMLSLIVIGEPFRAFFLRRLRLFADLDIMQICLLDVYVGGLVLFVIAMLPFQLFSKLFVLGLTLFGFIISACISLRSILRHRASNFRALLLKRRTAVLDYSLLLVMFVAFFCVQLTPLSNFVFGSVHDTSLHSLMVEVILENHQLPITLQPYLPEGIIYPQGAHVIFAYSANILNYEAPKAVFYVTTLFNSLSVFGAYFLGKKLWNNRKFYLGLSFVFAFVSAWPAYVTWGGNPFVTGFPFFLVCLGVLVSISQLSPKIEVKELVVAGILFGYSAVIIISYLQALMVVGFMWLLYVYIRRSNHRLTITKKFLLIFGVSLIPLGPFLGRFIVFYQYPGHNIGVPTDFSGWEKQQVSLSQPVEWIFGNLNPHLFLRWELICILVGTGVLLWKVKNDRNVKKVLLLAAAILMSSTLLSFASFFLSEDFGVISWGHQSIILIVPICILIAVFYVKITQFFTRFSFKWFPKVFSRSSYAALLISTVSLAVINIPFVYYRLAQDPQALASMYGLFAVTTQDDYDLMYWMRENVPEEAVVLVNPNEAGLFIPTVSYHRIVYPHTGSQLSYRFQRLVNLLTRKVLNDTAYELLGIQNITHVFVGSCATYWWEGDSGWDADIFLGNPNFRLLKSVGSSYLFEVSEFDSRVVFLDEFNYQNLVDMGWIIDHTGYGNGEAVTNSSDEGGFLIIDATRETDEISDFSYFFEYRVCREIYLWAISNVTLSFNISQSSGFNGLDAFAITISNMFSSRSIVIATPDGVFQLLDPNGSRTFTMENFVGDFQFNLSRLWKQAYNCSLPEQLSLEMLNVDINGEPNKVQVDSIKVSCEKD